MFALFGKLYGFSVQYAPEPGHGASDQLGDKATLDDLAWSGRFPHAIISFEDEAVLAAALVVVGYRMRLVASPGIGHHHTFCVVEDLWRISVGDRRRRFRLPSPMRSRRPSAVCLTHTVSPDTRADTRGGVPEMADMAHNTSDTSLTRVEVDFNTLNSAPVDLVKIAAPGSWQEQRLPPLCQGQRVLLFDADGLEVEATIIHDEQGWWMVAPDGDTWRDAQPATDRR